METEQERPATDKQLAYIRLLARRVGASLYLGNVKTAAEASRIIDNLKDMRDGMSRKTPVVGDRSRKDSQGFIEATQIDAVRFDTTAFPH